jgi:hypothetical protein
MPIVNEQSAFFMRLYFLELGILSNEPMIVILKACKGIN